MSAWPQISAPIFAGDNFRIAQQLSAATVNRPAAVPKESPVHNQPLPGRAALSNFKDSK